jgi:hypothetical protein
LSVRANDAAVAAERPTLPEFGNVRRLDGGGWQRSGMAGPRYEALVRELGKALRLAAGVHTHAVGALPHKFRQRNTFAGRARSPPTAGRAANRRQVFADVQPVVRRAIQGGRGHAVNCGRLGYIQVPKVRECALFCWLAKSVTTDSTGIGRIRRLLETAPENH